MIETRKIDQILKSKPTIEGAGVRLQRVFGYNEVPVFDPFLLLDDFHSNNPEDYIAGFPWHPHRGIETVTYMIHCVVEHGDSIGNKGIIDSGDLQWMTAGNGIIHQEMPQEYKGLMQGFQLWVNLPSPNKMMNPRYRGIIKEQIPEISISDGLRIKVIAGSLNGAQGPVQDLVVDVEYLDVMMSPNTKFNHSIKKGSTVFVYIFEGEGIFDFKEDAIIESEYLILFKDGEKIEIKTADQNLRFLMISGKPIGEPVAWNGPIVMNTQEELEKAFEEY
jgi:redox-sensitive bicupin YhaK (pirin superfamily)